MKPHNSMIQSSRMPLYVLPVLMLVLAALFSPSAQADIYVGSENNGGIIYQYSASGELMGATTPSFSGGAVGALGLQADTGNIVASTGGFLALLDSHLALQSFIGSGFSAFTCIASKSDGTVLAASSAGPGALSYWTSAGVYGGGFGTGFLDARISMGLSDTIFVTYQNGGTYSLAKFGADYGYLGTLANNVGSSIVTNVVTGQIWTSGNSLGQLLLFDTSGALIGAVGNGFDDGVIAASSNGKIWMASSYAGGSLSAWNSEGSYLGTYQSNLGSIAALTVDPTTGMVYVGLTDASGGINTYSDDGAYVGSFGFGLGITSLMATVPEPSPIALTVFCGITVVILRLRRKSLS